MSRVLSLWRGNILINTKTMNQIGAEVSENWGVTVDDLKGRSKLRKIAWARQEAMWRMADEVNQVGKPKYSRRQIGNWFGLDHSTVSYGCKVHALRNGLTVAVRNGGGFVCNSFADAEFVAYRAGGVMLTASVPALSTG
jgi:hypothetical protein